MASGCRNHCHAKSLEYSTLCVCDYGSREYISEIHQTLWSLITKPIMAFKFPILFSSRLLWQSGCLTVHVASLCCGALTSAWVQVSCKFNSYLTLLLLLNQRLPCSSSVATYIPHSAALIQLSFTQFSSLPPSHPHVQWELWCCSPDPAFIVRCPPYGSLKEKYAGQFLSLCHLFVTDVYIALQPTRWFPMVITLVAQSTHLPTSKHWLLMVSCA